LKYKYILFILIILLSIIRSNLYVESKYDINENEFYGVILDYKIKDTYITFTLKGKEKLKCNYYLNENENLNIKYGDKVYLTGKLKVPSNNTIPNIFNYKNYLNNNNIFYILSVDKIVNVKRNKSVFYIVKNKIKERIDKIDTNGYLDTFILGNKDYIDKEVYNNYKNNGIIHIFSISGMHISILSSIILYVLNKIRNNKYNIIFVISFLLFYLVLTNYQASIVRTIMFYIVLHVSKLLKLNISTKSSLLLAVSLILIINPKYIFNIGFLYSSIISFTLIYYSNRFNNKYILNLLYISFMSFLVSLPITINNNYIVNLLSIFINLIFVPLVSFILYPLSLITFVFTCLYPLFNFFISITEYLSNLISSINIFCVTIPKLNLLYIGIYYIVLYLSLSKNKKYFILLILIMIFIKYVNFFDSGFYLYYLDVGQGDTSVIKYKDKTIVIDTGGNPFNASYKISDNVIQFFHSVGITNIDLLILTHGDYDHMGEAINIVENFKVKKVIFNCGEFNELEKKLINVLDRKKISYYSCIKELNIDNNKLYFLNSGEYGNENDNSSVIYTELNNYKFLFMGDAGVEVEEDLIEKFNLQNIDVLKVGHHGSKTSSGKEFIDEINPKYSIISVGKNNRYGHPNKEVLNNLNKSKVYRTDQDGSIMFKIKNDKLKIEICVP